MISKEAIATVYAGIFAKFTPEEQDVIIRYFVACSQVINAGDEIMKILKDNNLLSEDQSRK